MSWKMLDELSGQDQGPILSAVASYERARGFNSAADMDHAIKAINKLRWANGKNPLKVAVDPSLTSRIAHRYMEHEHSQAVRNFIRTLAHHVPAQVLGVIPGQGAGRGMGDVADLGKKLGFKDVGELIPAMRGWHVNQKLFDWMRDSVGFEEEATGEGAVAKALSKPFLVVQRYLKHLNTSFSGIHIKNAAANALILGGPDVIKESSQIVGRAVKAARAGPKGQWFSPMMPIAKAIEQEPDYATWVRHGLFRTGHEYEMPLEDLIRMRLNPHGIKQGLMNWVGKGAGPMQTATFDVADRAMRMALARKYVRTGFTPARAAELTNSKLVDYSMRYLSGGARRLAHSAMTFPSWTIGNILSHGPNFIQNPFWYAAAAHAADIISDAHGGHTSAERPMALAGAFAMGHTVPGTNNQDWVQPGLPSQAIINLAHGVTDELAGGHPMAAAYLPARFAAQRLMPMVTLPGEIVAQRGGVKGMEKKGLMQTFLGDPKKGQSGLLGSALWGLEPYKIPEWIRALIDPSLWSTLPDQTKRLRLPGADTQGWEESLFTHPLEVTPGGKVVY